MQVRSIKQKDLVKGLIKDGWERDIKRGARQVFRKVFSDGEPRRVTIHYHPNHTFTVGTLRDILKDTAWTDLDLIDLKLIPNRR